MLSGGVWLSGTLNIVGIMNVGRQCIRRKRCRAISGNKGEEPWGKTEKRGFVRSMGPFLGANNY